MNSFRIKFLHAIFCLFASVTISFAQGTIPVPEILYYRFDGSGPLVPNYASATTSFTDTAVIVNGLTQGASSSLCNGALIGSGNSSSTDYLSTNYAPDLTGSWSISMWTADITPSATLFYIFGDINSNSFRCFTNGVAGPNNWILRGGFTDVYINGGATVAPHMTTFVYDVSTQFIYGYLDGVLVTSVAQAGAPVMGAGPLKVMGYSANVGAPAGGKLDEFRLYSHALTSAEVLQLYTRQTYGDTLSVSSCETTYSSPSGNYSWNTPGIYTDTIPNMYCGDSVITIDLTFISPTDSSFSETVCESYVSPSGLYTWTTSGIYMDTIPNAAGCDSVLTIDLIVNYIQDSTISETACESYLSPSGNYTWTTSGIYTDTIPSSANCDSIITIDLTVNYTQFSSISETVCGSYLSPSGNYTWTTSGTYADTIPSATGCDSVITINLTVDNLDLTTSVSGITISSNQANGTYQWINCSNNQPISNATGQSFTATANGSYAVVLSNANCSSDTSACVVISSVGISELSETNFNIQPNPTTSEVTVSFNGVSTNLVITDAAGKVVWKGIIQNNQPVSLENYLPGVYLFQLQSELRTVVKRVVKQ